VSTVTHRLSEDDARWLARMNRVIRARADALRAEREQEHRPADDEARQGTADGDHDAA
jgi:hypothetical protein